ncbi:hypothetical protein [Streptomyces europaeiscabiei]|uniref:hypothetical protein n=1 Tax=Streptomyces europaeiscabiei TaxID=146819 RepID=UPI002E151051|nr:hypothetical protein OHB30_27570 [Streptomyces europaeiscabiei]
MNTTVKRALCSTATSAALVIGSLAMIPAMATPAAAACQPSTYYKVVKYGSPTYKATGPTNSKYNSSSHKSTLSISVTRSTTRSSTWKAEAGGSVSWGIAKVEAKSSYEVTKSVTKGVKVTNKMVVDSKKRGYTRPMVEYRKFLIEKWREGGDCKQYFVGNMGTLTGITSSMHWAECQTRSENGCTPKP